MRGVLEDLQRPSKVLNLLQNTHAMQKDNPCEEYIPAVVISNCPFR